MKCKCGLSYVPEDTEDAATHAELHEEYSNGPIMTPAPDRTSISTIGGASVYWYGRGESRAVRRSLASLALVAQRSMPEFPSGFDSESSETDAFIAVEQNRAIALCLISTEECFWELGWMQGTRVVQRSEEQVFGARLTVGRLWVAAASRNRGLARGLLLRAALHRGTTIDQVGWQLPLTRDGRGLLYRLLPQRWLGAGDLWALRETLAGVESA